MHHLYYLLRRGLSGIRHRPALYALSLLTLAATFLSFTATLTAALNLDHFMKKWVGTAELTVYLKEGATDADMEKLAAAITAIPEISHVEIIPQNRAKEMFAKQMTGYEEMVRALPETTFPASVDVHLKKSAVTDTASRERLAKRIEMVSMVENVDLYENWYTKIITISTISQVTATALGLLSLVVSILVVSATVRASIAARTREIEVLELVGATHRYIRFPFQLEGAFQTVAAMLLALLILHMVTNHLQTVLNEMMPLIGLSALIRLSTTSLFMLIGGSAVAGLLGSRLSMKKGYEA